MTGYRVALDVYDGPMDLLLFLIRRDEVDICDIPIALITEQYLSYVEMLRALDPEVVSEFLVLAATLMEIKSRMLLPRPCADEADEELMDPRLELVRQLLEYKKYKDAAGYLEDEAAERARKFPRRPVLPPQSQEEVELESLEIWDLFEAFHRLLEQTGRTAPVHQIGVDDTPVALHAADIVDAIDHAGGQREFELLFTGRSKPEMIGLFLALLELIRQRRVRAVQDRAFGPIVLVLLDATPIDVTSVPEGEAEDRPEDADRKTPLMDDEGSADGSTPPDTEVGYRRDESVPPTSAPEPRGIPDDPSAAVLTEPAEPEPHATEPEHDTE